MPQALKEREARLPAVLEAEADDPREVAGELTRELAELTAEKFRLQDQLVIQDPSTARETRSRIGALERRTERIHAQIHYLANHC